MGLREARSSLMKVAFLARRGGRVRRKQETLEKRNLDFMLRGFLGDCFCGFPSMQVLIDPRRHFAPFGDGPDNK